MPKNILKYRKEIVKSRRKKKPSDVLDYRESILAERVNSGSVTSPKPVDDKGFISASNEVVKRAIYTLAGSALTFAGLKVCYASLSSPYPVTGVVAGALMSTVGVVSAIGNCVMMGGAALSSDKSDAVRPEAAAKRTLDLKLQT